MLAATRESAIHELQQIPGVGRVIAEDLWNIGIRSVRDLRNKDPETLYVRVCAYQGAQVDRCMLYVLRCAVYYATVDRPNPILLKWWNWKDR